MEARYSGKWWVPDVDRHVPGELIVEPDQRARLEINEPLSDGVPTSSLPVVLGTSASGEVITLMDAVSLGTSRTSTRKLEYELVRETLSPGVVLVGAHLPRPDDHFFHEATLDLTDLMGFAGPSGIREGPGANGAEVSIWIDRPESLVADLPGAQIKLGHGWGTKGDGVRVRTVEATVSFWVRSERALDVREWLQAYISPLRDLLTLAAGNPNEVARFEVKTPVYDSTYGTWVEVWYPRGHTDRDPAIHGFDFLFDAASLGGDFGRAVARWFELYEKLDVVIPLFLGPRYRPDTFADNHFLNTTSAAEAYHRILYRNEVLPRTAHRARLSSVTSLAPKEHRAWLRERLAHSNEPTFRERLQDLHARAFDVVAGVVGSADEFADPIARLRNGLTHRGNGTPQSTPQGVEVFRLTQLMRFVLESCLMLDLGLAEALVFDASRRSASFRWITELEMRSRMRASSVRPSEL